VAFQWFADGVIYGVSVHGITDVNRRIVRELLDNLDLVGPQSQR
jgi:tryptophan synthase alpha subunit